MDYKKTNAPTNTVTRNMMDLCEDTGNVYETVVIIGKRANQIAVEMKNDLSKKLQEFASYNDNLEEVFENREQIEISRYYEKLPKPTLIAAQEYEEGKVYYRNPAKEKKNCNKGPFPAKAVSHPKRPLFLLNLIICKNSYDTAYSNHLLAGGCHPDGGDDVFARRKPAGGG